MCATASLEMEIRPSGDDREGARAASTDGLDRVARLEVAAQMAFCTLPPLRQRVQTYARVATPFRSTRTRWRFGLKRRFVATIECERWFPNPGFFPQTEQTLDTAGQCSDQPVRALTRSCANRSAISSALRTASAARSSRASPCATFSTVSTPNETGIPVSIAASWRPEAASEAM